MKNLYIILPIVAMWLGQALADGKISKKEWTDLGVLVANALAVEFAEDEDPPDPYRG